MSKKVQNLILFALSIIPYILLIFPVGDYLEAYISIDNPVFFMIAHFICTMLFAIIITYISIIIHEGGHLVCGLLSGYHFISFRIGSVMLVKTDNHLKLKKYSLAGTGGQCLLDPPDLNNGDYPFTFYNMGGVLFNLLVAIIFFGLKCFATNPLLDLVCYSVAIMNLFLGLSNGIPLQGSVSNDGYNILDASKSPASKKALWAQFKTAYYSSQGIRTKDMDPQLFYLDQQNLDNSTVAWCAINQASRYFDQRQFEQAYNLYSLLLQQDSVSQLHKQLIRCDMLTISLMKFKESCDAKIMEDKTFKQFLQQMKSNPVIIRTLYAYEKLYTKNSSKANNQLEQIKKLSDSYPYPAEIEAELEMIEIINQTL